MVRKRQRQIGVHHADIVDGIEEIDAVAPLHHLHQINQVGVGVVGVGNAFIVAAIPAVEFGRSGITFE